MLEVQGLSVYYGGVQALREVSLEVGAGEFVALIGANGAGKTTLLRTVSGLKKAAGGAIKYEGRDICRLSPETIVRLGLSHCPEGRRVWPHLTVRENLLLGAFTRRQAREIKADLERVWRYFPRLYERQRQAAGTLSGGEQQMLAIGRALMARPRLLMLDEPSLGLAPIMVQGVAEIIKRINEDGTTVLLVEQNASMALRLASRTYVLETGRVVREGPSGELSEDEAVRSAYLGGG
ncbi:MAG TPA: ABC transporter ATP-binding protein [Firmicutes bacterium]|nr:ABC transporter ATP-binding protein [Bacillota bacterium]